MELEWAVKRLKGKSLLSMILRLAWRASIYYIWRERNGRRHGQASETPSQIVKHIKSDIRLKTISIKNITNDSVNSLLCYN